MKLIAAFAGLFLVAQAAQRLPPAVMRLDSGTVGDEPPIVLNAEKAWAGGDVLWPLATSGDLAVRHYAIRAIGRLEDPGNVPRLLALAQTNEPTAAATAIAQSLNGFDPARAPDLIGSVSEWLRVVTFVDGPKLKSVMPAPIGSIVWSNPEQVHAAEDALLRILDWAAYDKNKVVMYVSAVRSLESLGRLNVKVSTFNPETVTRLRGIVGNTGVNDVDGARENAVAALIATRGLDADTELIALRDPFEQVRRLATTVLAGAGAGLDDERRLNSIQERLGDSNGQVRYEAVKAYVRRSAATRGCAPLLDVVADRDTSVAIAAIDALGDLCKDDETSTARIVAEARTPAGSAWHREAHAFVALAKRAPEGAAISMEAFVAHPSWWVRMYAARAAGAADDVVHLDKLAYDTSDNVREAALGPLRRLKKADADPALVAALDRNDVQLLRTAATLLKTSAPSDRTARSLVNALVRLTKEGKETSRDARIPLLEAIDIHGGPEIAPDLTPLVTDFDPIVAAKAAAIVSRLTGKTVAAEPVHVTRGWAKSFDDLRQCVSVSLASGKSFTLRMNPSAAPVTVDRFLSLALAARYYDGLTIHRIAPNFVIQGGSPGANEYAGHKEYMRDEIGARNIRGTVGLSTRGRNTADAQFYVNLIDNARLDADYTVFASVMPADMPVVDAIQEGDVMRGMSAVRCSAIR
ncbi:MAG TPA: peptidylprolyl isomerase [Vicinamibacterales bacterium]